MKSRFNLKGYIVVFVACLLVMVMLFRQRVPFGRGNTNFAVKENIEISKVILYEKGEKLTLMKDREDEWIIKENGKVREEAISSLLKILKEMKIKYPISSDNFNRDISATKTEPVKVYVFGKNRLVKSFFVYQTSSNIYGNVMKMKPFSKPFVMYVPGYDADIGHYFTASMLFWKPFVVFDCLPSEIEYVSVLHFKDTLSSFRINCSRKNYELIGSNNKPVDGWDTLKVKRYISYFTYIPFEKWSDQLSLSQKDSISSSLPLYRITLKKKNNDPVELTIWQKSVRNENGEEIIDPDRLWGKSGANEEIFIVRYFDIDPVLKKLSYFMMK